MAGMKVISHLFHRKALVMRRNRVGDVGSRLPAGDCFAVSTIKRSKRGRDVGIAINQIGDDGGRRHFSEGRIGENLRQLRRPLGFPVSAQFPKIKIVDGCEFQHELRGERALIALDKIEIARRYAKILGHRDLTETQRRPQMTDALSRKNLTLGHLFALTTFTTITVHL